jgi:uncharacterized membrane protein YhhN
MANRLLLIVAGLLLAGAVLNRLVQWQPTWYYLLEATAMPFLWVYAARNIPLPKVRLQFLAGFACWIAGDFLYKFALGNDGLMGGLMLLYIVGDTCYAWAFFQEIRAAKKPFFLNAFWIFLPTLSAILLLSLQLMWPGLGPLQAVTTMLAVALLVLCLVAVARWHAVSDASFFYVAIGCIMFVLSNLLYGVNNFIMPLPGNGTLELLTYFAAQFCLVMGITQPGSAQQDLL